MGRTLSNIILKSLSENEGIGYLEQIISKLFLVVFAVYVGEPNKTSIEDICI